MSEIASAPELSAARARGSMALTFGESLTISGRRAMRRAWLTSSASRPASLEK